MNILMNESGETIWVDTDSVNVVGGVHHVDTLFFRMNLYVGAQTIPIERSDVEVLEEVRCDIITTLEKRL